jgi:hypothetical protein
MEGITTGSTVDSIAAAGERKDGKEDGGEPESGEDSGREQHEAPAAHRRPRTSVRGGKVGEREQNQEGVSGDQEGGVGTGGRDQRGALGRGGPSAGGASARQDGAKHTTSGAGTIPPDIISHGHGPGSLRDIVHKETRGEWA